MTSSKIAAVVLGAGKGTRMKSDLPKVLMPICGKPMIRNILDTLDGMDADKIVVVTAPDGELVRKEVAPHRSVIQQQQLGTGDAVMAAALLAQNRARSVGHDFVLYCGRFYRKFLRQEVHFMGVYFGIF